MIVLDEQLLGRGIEHNIARWYRGKVQFITELRPKTVIKDDAIPTLRFTPRQTASNVLSTTPSKPSHRAVAARSIGKPATRKGAGAQRVQIQAWIDFQQAFCIPLKCQGYNSPGNGRRSWVERAGGA